MRYLGKISDPKDLVTKEYVDGKGSGADVSTKQDRTDLLTEDNDFIIGVPETCKVPYYTAEGAENYSCSLSGLLTGAILNQAGTGVGLLRTDNGVISKVASIGTSDIAEKAVTTEKIALGAVTGNQITDGSITTSKIQQNTITTEKIVQAAVTADKLANNIPYTKFGLSADQVRGIYIGTATPSNTLGNNGDIYIKYNA